MTRIALALGFSALLLSAAFAEEKRPERVYDLQHVKWRISYDMSAHSILGDVTNRVVAIKNGIRNVWFDCDKLELRTVTVDGNPVAWIHEGDKLTVRLDAPANAGDVLNVRIQYWGKPTAGVYFVPAERAFPSSTGMVYTQGEMIDTRCWLPTYDAPDDKTTFEGFIEVPRGHYALSNGKLMGVQKAGDRDVYHWKIDQPQATYLISFVAGQYVEKVDSWRGIPVSYLVPPGLEAMGEASFAETPKIMEFFSNLTRFPYPYDKFAQIVVGDYMFGGMENTTCVTQTIDTLHPKSAQPVVSSRGLVAHEMAHQWFGDTVTCAEWKHVWINEGFASMLPNFYTREVTGQDEFHIGRQATFAGAYAAQTGVKKRPVVWSGYTHMMDLFDGCVFGGGAARLYMLMRLMGEQTFWDGVGQFLKENKFRSVTTEGFFETMSRAARRDLTPFMKQWLYRSDVPRLTVSRSGPDLLIRQHTETPFDLTLDVWILDGERWVKRQVHAAKAEVRMPLGLHLNKPLLIDPEVWLLAQIRYDLGYTPEHWAQLFRQAPNAAQKMRLLAQMGPQPAIMLDLARTEPSPRVRDAILPQIGPEAADYLLELSRSDDAITRNAAVLRLSVLPSSEPLILHLERIWRKDPNDAVRLSALRALLAVTGDPGYATEAWHRRTYNDAARVAALEWWSRTDPDEGRERCLAIMESPPSEPLRIAAIQALGRLKDRPGERRAFEALAKEVAGSAFKARQNAIQALANYGDPAAISLLEPLREHSLHFIYVGARTAIQRLKAATKG